MKRSKSPWLLGFCALGLLIASCGSQPGDPGRTTTVSTDGTTSGSPQSGSAADQQVRYLESPVPRMQPTPVATAADQTRKLGVRLFSDIRSGTENSVVSPYSVYVALGMTQAGAKGDTAAQLARVLGADPAAAVTAIDAALGAAKVQSRSRSSNREATVINSANSLWSQSNLPIHQTYLDALAAGYGTGMYQTDFIADPMAAKDRINDWVSERTKALIPELLGERDITDLTRVVLVNALYLSAEWNQKFIDTAPGNFTGLDGTLKQVPQMAVQTGLRFSAGDGWESVTIPYQGDGLAMTLVVPDPGSFENVAAGVTAELIAAATTGGTNQDALLRMPPFSAGSRAPLADSLKAQGITDLFDRARVDLTGIFGVKGDLVVSEVIHQTIVKVDKDGTTAAAATAVIAEAGSAPNPVKPKEFVVDRPFLFVIHDTQSNAPLFLGQVLNP